MQNITVTKLWLIAGLVTVAIIFFTPKPPPKSVDYYLENKAARLERLAECQKNVSALKDDGDCLNAKQAAMKAWSKPNLPRFDPSNSSGEGRVSPPPSQPAN